MKISEAVTDVVDQLINAGIEATQEPSEISIPGALVMPGEIDFSLLGDDYEMSFEVYLVANAQRTQAETLDELQELLEKFRTVFTIKTAQPAALPLTKGNLIPSLLISFTAVIS